MASRDGSDRAAPSDAPAPSTTTARPASIVSSRMTDIASDDGKEKRRYSKQSRPKSGAELSSRPGTAARTGASRAQPLPFRKQYGSGLSNISSQQNSSHIGAGASKRSSRSHVPSITQSAFMKPMSSQRLQAQRAGGRPQPLSKPVRTENLDEGTTDFGGSVTGHEEASPTTPVAGLQRDSVGPENDRQLPSRGTEMTEQETLDRITANTSPTHGYYAGGSMSSSVQPLRRGPEQQQANNHNHNHNNHNNLRVDVGQTRRAGPSIPSPIKSPRSFRSSFLLAGSESRGQNRSTDGHEKLPSNASSPNLRDQYSRGNDSTGQHHHHHHHADGKVKRMPTHGDNNGRVHEFFDGNTRFWFGGRWQNARQRPINIATGIFTVVPGILFFIFEAPWLWHNISPAIPITVAYLCYITTSSFIHASVSDPGILPRNLHQFPPVDENEDPLRPGPATVDWTQVKSHDPATAALEFPMKHCRTCNIWRPPRAHHCRLCDNCIEGHDHHCVWLNNCVGRRNYRYFFTFVTSATLLAIYIIATSFLQLTIYKNRQATTFTHAINHFRGAFALGIIACILFIYPAALMGYHIFLMARGETTREYINSHKFAKAERFRPFSQGNIFKNLAVVLFRPRPPTYYRFKAQRQVGDQRLGDQKRVRSGGVVGGRRFRAASQGMEMQNVKRAGDDESGFQGPVALQGGGGAGGAQV